MNPEISFWRALAELVKDCSIIVDRPRGSAHPRYPGMIYPLDYGYLENTRSGDGGGIDVWLGSLINLRKEAELKTLTGILCTFDTLKRDAEIRLLIGCNAQGVQIIRDFHKEMHTLYLPTPAAEHDLSS